MNFLSLEENCQLNYAPAVNYKLSRVGLHEVNGKVHTAKVLAYLSANPNHYVLVFTCMQLCKIQNQHKYF